MATTDVQRIEPTAVDLAIDVVDAERAYLVARGLIEAGVIERARQGVSRPKDLRALVDALDAADRAVDAAHALCEHLAALSENDERPELSIERKSKAGKVSRVTLAKLEREAVAREITTRYYDWVKANTGKAPILTFPAIMKIVETAYQRGWEPRDVVIAMGELYRTGATLTAQSLERQLDGRARRRAQDQPRTATGRAMAKLRDRMEKGTPT